MFVYALKDSFREAIPVPNCFSVINRGSRGSSIGYHVMTQGSGDLVATLCTDVWDGQGVSTLTEFDRSRMLDFYNQNVSTAYCQAFAYKPLLHSRLSLFKRHKHGSSCTRDHKRESSTRKSDECLILELPVVSTTPQLHTYSNKTMTFSSLILSINNEY